MNTISIEKKFAKMGARVKVTMDDDAPGVRLDISKGRRRLMADDGVRLNVLKDKKGTYFSIIQGKNAEIEILDVKPKDRHLLLMTRNSDGKSKFLAGHDERDWFVAAIPESSSASTVHQAMEALKPDPVLTAQSRKKLKAKDQKRRKTQAYIRQGEWFFLPCPDLKVDEALILKKEPLQRGGGKPHMAEFLYRTGGRMVWVSSSYPNGISAAAYARLDKVARAGMRSMQRDPEVYVRGRITHSDHKTIILDFWHKVEMNTETKARAMRNVAFLD